MKVKFVKETKIKKEKTILEVAEDMNIKIKASCGGKGKCGKCIVKVINGKVSEPTKNEKKLLKEKELEQGYRLACEAVVTADVEIILE
jgi:ferredoxin